jgi:hypothetical protein
VLEQGMAGTWGILRREGGAKQKIRLSLPRIDPNLPRIQGRIGHASAPHMHRFLITPDGLTFMSPPGDNKEGCFY